MAEKARATDRDAGASSPSRGTGGLVAELAIALPALGYAAAYEFQLGRVRAMGLPDELLSLGLRDIVAGTIAVLVAGALILGVIRFFALLTSGDDVGETEKAVVGIVVPIAVLGLLFLLSGQLDSGRWVIYLGSAVLMVAAEFAPPWWRSAREGGSRRSFEPIASGNWTFVLRALGSPSAGGENWF